MLREPRQHTVLKSIATSTKSFAVIVKSFAWITSSESSSWFALVQNWWIQSECSFLVELLRIAIIVKSFAWVNKIFCYSRKNLNTVSFVQEAGDRESFACLHVLNACLHVQRRHPRDGAWETAWVQKFCQQLNQVKFDVYVVISYTIALECSALSLSETIPSVCLTSHVFLELRWDISGDSVRQIKRKVYKEGMTYTLAIHSI